MTPGDLLAEQFDHATTEPRTPVVLAPWTTAEQARHRADLFAAVGTRVTVPPRPPRPAKPAPPPSMAVREALVDGLPPDVRDHAIVIRAASR
ncbi:MAG TPA: hypothetical protein VK942_17155 [Actinomycetes bacterium]|nr:hypothetical protein [Actinomycetes bacterium]